MKFYLYWNVRVVLSQKIGTIWLVTGGNCVAMQFSWCGSKQVPMAKIQYPTLRAPKISAKVVYFAAYIFFHLIWISNHDAFYYSLSNNMLAQKCVHYLLNHIGAFVLNSYWWKWIWAILCNCAKFRFDVTKNVT